MGIVSGRPLCRLSAIVRIRIGLGLGLALAAILALTPPNEAAAQSYNFTDVRIEGNERVDPGTILGFAQIGRGEALTGGELNAAYQRIVNSGLFETVELVPSGNTLIVRVREWPIVNVISIEGNDKLNDEELQALVGSQPRRVYDPTQAEADAAAIAEAYEVRGRLAATVTPRIIRRSDNRVDLVFEIVEGQVVEVERLSFVGNRAFSDRRLRRVLETKQAGLLRTFVQRDTFIAERLDLDRRLLTDFYNSRGYVDFRILGVNSEFARERNAFFVTISVQEGQQFRFGAITASTDLPGVDAAEFLRLARIDSGDIYSPQAVDIAVTRMERLAIRKGLSFVRAVPVITRDERNQRLNVDFHLERGPRIFVERIDIEGNATTLDRVIRRQFDIVEGDPFNPREIRASAERIRALGYFSQADVEARDGTAEGLVIVDVDVEEQPTGSLTLGGSYSTNSGVGVNLGFSERNFLGRGQTLSFDITTGTDASAARFSFIEPYFLGRDLSARLDVFYETSDFDEADYNTQVVGFSPALTFPVSLNGRLTLRYRLSEDTIENVDDGEPDLDPDTGERIDTGSSPILQREEEDRLTSAVGYTYSYDTRRTGIDPNAGVLFRFGQDFAGLGGDSQYVKTTAQGIYQRRVWNEEVTLRATVEGGAINALNDKGTRVTDRFFLSTAQLRGFAPLGVGPRDLEASNEDALGGNLYSVARLEAEFPLGLPEEYGLRGGVFFDAGSVWSLEDVEGENGVEVDDSFNLRTAVGVSLFWTSPLGPLQFNFAKALSKEDYDETQVFNLSLQTAF
ncbi:surface antigen (D15) [Oceaniovalibus guishaninsula JLT2003]|uniref:Outer membrane protein assembly factor BamA n=1 Tax=Oceaniovalibus guishaninsula JLT2003 TaxID=1231392 RepID=K2H7L9_9RHOB|nr:outer membrane protein assembly factor BamA [Oceaniovalibus guishaninsula]EKE43613.1 surface antigen (D15) [Oceaniovalibus guishaninsula JLT2003]